MNDEPRVVEVSSSEEEEPVAVQESVKEPEVEAKVEEAGSSEEDNPTKQKTEGKPTLHFALHSMPFRAEHIHHSTAQTPFGRSDGLEPSFC